MVSIAQTWFPHTTLYLRAVLADALGKELRVALVVETARRVQLVQTDRL